jgi:acylphosphatase
VVMPPRCGLSVATNVRLRCKTVAARNRPLRGNVGAVVRYRVFVSGRVQGVFFRDTCRRMAVENRVSGWVRNLPDGRVEAVFEGKPDDVQRLVDWARHGPRHAAVTDVWVRAEQPEGLDTFDITLLRVD